MLWCPVKTYWDSFCLALSWIPIVSGNTLFLSSMCLKGTNSSLSQYNKRQGFRWSFSLHLPYFDLTVTVGNIMVLCLDLVCACVCMCGGHSIFGTVAFTLINKKMKQWWTLLSCWLFFFLLHYLFYKELDLGGKWKTQQVRRKTERNLGDEEQFYMQERNINI